MYRFLLTRQWVILTLLAIVLIPVMVRLGFWQLHRHEDRVARNDLITENLEAARAPVTELTAPGRAVPESDKYRTVTAKGSYEPRHEVVVRQRLGGAEKQGYFVVTPLRLDGGAAVLVNRGWIPAGEDLTSYPDVPEPPTGEVTVTGRLLADETTAASGIEERSGLPDRQVMLIDSRGRAAEGVSGPVLGGHIQLTGTSPEPAGEQPEPVPSPDHSSIGPHLAYAVQWWLFAAGVPVGWWFLVRRERRERSAREEGAAGDAASLAPAEPVTAD